MSEYSLLARSMKLLFQSISFNLSWSEMPNKLLSLSELFLLFYSFGKLHVESYFLNLHFKIRLEIINK